jgi:hypothetical protein
VTPSSRDGFQPLYTNPMNSAGKAFSLDKVASITGSKGRSPWKTLVRKNGMRTCSTYSGSKLLGMDARNWAIAAATSPGCGSAAAAPVANSPNEPAAEARNSRLSKVVLLNNVGARGTHDSIVQYWGLFLALGICQLLLGVVAIGRSVAATIVSMLFFGWLLVSACGIEVAQAAAFSTAPYLITSRRCAAATG